jgi:hypothetical protein
MTNVMCTNYDELLDWALAQGIVKPEEKAGVLDGTTTNEVMDMVEGLAAEEGVWIPDLKMLKVDPGKLVEERMPMERILCEVFAGGAA